MGRYEVVGSGGNQYIRGKGSGGGVSGGGIGQGGGVMGGEEKEDSWDGAPGNSTSSELN